MKHYLAYLLAPMPPAAVCTDTPPDEEIAADPIPPPLVAGASPAISESRDSTPGICRLHE